MAHKNHEIAHAYFAAVRNGELPDALLTPDMTAWTTLSGITDKAGYQSMVKMLGRMCAQPPVFTVRSLTAEDDRVIAEANSVATLVNGENYSNSYVFVIRVRDGRIASIAEHFNAVTVIEKLVPLMKTLSERKKTTQN
jgi:ketosteroid isomerase-like protein